jgi:hypothetical protein
MMRGFFIIAVCLLIGAATDRSFGKDRAEVIWSALILATNEPQPKPAPPELARYKPRLEKIFGYNHFELLNAQTRVMDTPDERWLIPGKDFSMRVSSKEEARKRYLLQLQLYRDKTLLVETEAKLAPESPLFIRGPLYGRGQLIIVILVQAPK